MNDGTHKLIKRFFLYLAAWLFIGVPFALLYGGIWPKNITGWIIVVVFGVPILILGEFVGETLFSQRIGRALDPAKIDKLLSARRIAYALVIGIAVTALILLLGYLFRSHVGKYFIIA